MTMVQPINTSFSETLPLLAPPPNVVPNFVDPESRAYQMYIGMGVCIGIASIFMFLRLYVKVFISQTWNWDDFTCLMGYISIVTHDALAISIAGPGPQRMIGVHEWDIPVSSFTKEFLQRTLGAVELYALGALLVKLSLFILYLRLFRPNKLTRWLIVVGTVVCIIFYSVSIIFNAAICIPSPYGPNNTPVWVALSIQCGQSQELMALAQAVFGTLSDIYLLVIPNQIVWRLHMSTKCKLGISAVFTTGLIAVACSIGSLIYRIEQLHIADKTWWTVKIFTFSNAEVSAGVICATAPILPALRMSSGSSGANIFRLPKSLRYFTLRDKSSRSSSSRQRFWPGARSEPVEYSSGSRYLKSSSEQDLTYEMSNGSQSGSKGINGGNGTDRRAALYHGSNV